LTSEAVDETSIRYEGWRVAAASRVGVFVSFASLLVYTFGIFLKPLAEEFSWSREAVSAARGLRSGSNDRRRLLAAAGLSARSRQPAQSHRPCLMIFGCAFASLALLTPHLWHLYAVFLVLVLRSWSTTHRGLTLL
jgi:hypothetical protein